MENTLKFNAIQAKQSNKYQVYTFVAKAQDIFKIAKIDRLGRNDSGDIFGFQRPQVARHIHEIRDYFCKDDAVLPNSVVIAFVGNIKARKGSGPIIKLSVSVDDSPPGYVVDGQQRLSALQGIENCELEVFVSAIVCKDMEDLRRQFILINNTKPLPNELIYELLPTVSELPPRMSNRSFAANLASRLNYEERPENGDRSALKGQIKLHTNPTGNISCNAIHKAIMNSRSNGALREITNSEDYETKSFNLIEDFYGAVMDLFEEAWIGYGPRESRLRHSVGIISLSYAMEMAYFKHGASTRMQFRDCLECLQEEGVCAWTHGNWIFNREEVRPWNKLQNTSPDIRLLSEYLSRIVKDGGIKHGSEVDLARKKFKNQIDQEY